MAPSFESAASPRRSAFAPPARSPAPALGNGDRQIRHFPIFCSVVRFGHRAYGGRQLGRDSASARATRLVSVLMLHAVRPRPRRTPRTCCRIRVKRTLAERLRYIWDRSGRISRVAAGNRIRRRLRGFPASPDISRHRSSVVEVEAALRQHQRFLPIEAQTGERTGARLISIQ